MCHKSLEFAAKGLALDPVTHESAIGSAETDCSRSVDIRNVLLDVIKALHQIQIWTPAPFVSYTVLESHPIAGATCWIRCHNDVALFGEYGRIPPCAPTFIPSTLRTTVNQIGQRVLLRLVETGWFHY